MSRALYEQDVVRRVLALREDLVRHDDNLSAWRLMSEAVPWFVADHPDIVAARERQREMCLHLIDPEAYRDYYATNPHERPFEEQYPGATVDNAHEVFHRVAFLRKRLPVVRVRCADLEGRTRLDDFRVLDASCNDAWMVANLALAGYKCDGVDLNPDCIERAKLRKQRADCGLMGWVTQGDVVAGLPALYRQSAHHAIVFFETIEHVADPDKALHALAAQCEPGGALFISTPNGVDHGGDLPNWDHVERKGHVRVYVPSTFKALLERHGTVERMEQGPDGVMVAEVAV
ncbi:MAG: class I SAM-dependent methyltransferase [Chloroflexi bacterium]|nr:class I SAM-dependent methyltransferase [Chloroflexota bacterium]